MTEPDPTDDGSRGSLLQRARARGEQLLELRYRFPAVDAAFETYERDRALNGNIFASALAFRLFLWMLPLVLVLVATLGFVVAGGGDAEDTLTNVGVSGLSASTIAENLSRSTASRWWVLSLGLVALYAASITLAKVIHRVHAMAWGSPESRLKAHPRVAALVIGVAGAVLVVTGLTARVEALSGVGWFLRLALLALYGAVWLGVSWLLPHRDAPFVRLVPGALLTAAGVEAIHLVTVVYISRKLNSASELYGALGASVVTLLWLYLIARLVVAASVLNATLWDRQQRRSLS